METSEELYNKKDVEMLSEKINDIVDKVRVVYDEIIDPTKKEIDAVTKLILEYLEPKKRKIYGGYALHKLINNANPDDGIYKKSDSPDIDFYSPEPLKDLFELCDLINEKGYKYVTGREAVHRGTYNLFVNMHLYCDITYVPNNIYNHMPFMKIDGLTIIHPYFMAIDYLRMLTDPLLSIPFRFKDKPSFKRFYLLQHYYPFYNENKKVNIEGKKENKEIDDAKQCIYDYMKNNKTIISVGHYAYYKYLDESKVVGKNYDKKNIPFFEFISSNYRNDALELIEKIKKVVKDPNQINYVEYYPFFQFFGYSVRIYYGETLLVKVYDNNLKCLPYVDVPYYEINKNKLVSNEKYIVRIGTFALTVVWCLINVMKYRCDENITMQNMYYTMISDMKKFRINFMKKENKNIYDDTIFKEFVTNCVGKVIPPEREKQMLYESRKQKGKRGVMNYKPADGKQSPPDYIFENSSGNEIKNDKYRRLNKKTDNIDEIIEPETSESIDKKKLSRNITYSLKNSGLDEELFTGTSDNVTVPDINSVVY